MVILNNVNRTSRVAFVTGLIAIAMGALPATAVADEFSPIIKPKEYSILGDCSLTLGPVWDDDHNDSNYRLIGGAQVNCSSKKETIAVTVREFESAGGNSPTMEIGRGIGTTFANSYGFGAKILELNVGCGVYNYWVETRAYVTVDGMNSGWKESGWQLKKSGC